MPRTALVKLDIWVRQAAGGEPARLTTDGADDYQPDFSTDGNRIALASLLIFILLFWSRLLRLITRPGLDGAGAQWTTFDL